MVSTIDSIPFLLAPSSRPSSPNNSSNLNEIDPILIRLKKQDQLRLKLGLLQHNEGLGLILPPLLSCGIKGSWKDKSPWDLNEKENRTKIDEEVVIGPWNYDLPHNMEEWEEWEIERKLIREKIRKGKRKEEVIDRIEMEVVVDEITSTSLLSLEGRRSSSHDSDSSGKASKGSSSSDDGSSTSEQEVVTSASTSNIGVEKSLLTYQSLPIILPSTTTNRQITLISTLSHSKPFLTNPSLNKKSNSVPLSLPSLIPSIRKATISPPSSPNQLSHPPYITSLQEENQHTLSRLSNTSQSLPNLISKKELLKDPLQSASPLKSISTMNIEEEVLDWKRKSSRESDKLSLGSVVMELGGIEDELLGEVGNSQFILDDNSPTKPLPTSLPNSIPIPSLPLPSIFPLPPLSLSLSLIPTPTPPLNTSTPTISIPLSIPPIVPEGRRSRSRSSSIKLSKVVRSRDGSNFEMEVEEEEEISLFLDIEVKELEI